MAKLSAFGIIQKKEIRLAEKLKDLDSPEHFQRCRETRKKHEANKILPWAFLFEERQ